MAVPSRTTRPRLAAVWFADICGFARLAARDEPSALELVALVQRLAAAQVSRQRGRVVKHVGDAVLAEFPSVRAAARAALSLVREFEEKTRPLVRGVPLHVGLHIGEISEAADGDVYGDGVNIAARLQEQAPPGAVLVSGDAWRQLRPLREFRARRDAQRVLRDVTVRVSTYILTSSAETRAGRGGGDDPDGQALQLPLRALVGRTPELTLLRATLDRLLAGRGGTLLLPGEAGVGKTRLAQVLAAEAEADGVQVASGHAYPVETGVPYALIADALLPLARRHGHAAALNDADELASLFPVFRRGHERALPADDPTEFKGRLLWTFTERLRALARHAPLVLILDDVQWADASSLELLHFLARQTADDPILIVCTYIDTIGSDSALRAVEGSLLGLGVARRHHVDALAPAAVHQLISTLFPGSGEDAARFASLLHEWTGGNVFFAQEVLQSLVTGGHLRRAGQGWEGWSDLPLELPRTVRQAVMQRLQQLTPAARIVAGIAAVVGARAQYRLLRAAAGIPESDVLAAIDALCAAGILTECVGEGGSVSFEFRHPIAREVIYRELSAARRARLHGTVAEVLERAPMRGTRERVDDLAYHFARADPEDYAPRAVHYLIEAGTAALTRFANQEAADYLTRALEVAGLVRHDAPPDAVLAAPGADGDLRIAMDRLASAHQRLGEYDAAASLLRTLLHDAEERANTTAVANLQRRIGLNCFWAGRHADALRHLHAAVEPAERAGARRAVARTELALGACYQELGRAREAAERIARAHAIAEDLGDDSLAARTHRALLMLHTWIGPADTARRHGALAIELAERRQEPTVAFFSHWTLAVLEGLTGNTDRMAEHIRECEGRARALSSPLLRLWVDELSIEYAWARGDWERGLVTGRHAIALARSLAQPKLLPRLLVWTSLILIGRGEMAAAEACVSEAWQISGADDAAGNRPMDVHVIVPAHIGRASLHLARQEYHEAIAVGEAGLAIADRSGYPFWAIHRLLPIIGEAALLLRDLDRAEAVDRRLRSDSERLGHRLGLAWADAGRALTVWLRGDAAAGTALLRAAVQGLDAIPIVPDAARLRRQLAGRLFEIGQKESALAELTQAFEVLHRLGAAPELAKARAMFDEFGAVAPREPAGTPRAAARVVPTGPRRAGRRR